LWSDGFRLCILPTESEIPVQFRTLSRHCFFRLATNVSPGCPTRVNGPRLRLIPFFEPPFAASSSYSAQMGQSLRAVEIEIASLTSKSFEHNGVAPPPNPNWSLLEPCLGGPDELKYGGHDLTEFQRTWNVETTDFPFKKFDLAPRT